MAIYGYHRTSTKDQHLDRGVLEIKAYCENNNLPLVEIFTDQQTGKNLNRPEYLFLKKRILPGDTLIISEIDRLGRNKEEILKELRYYKDKKVRVMILEIPTTLIDYSKLETTLAILMMETVNNMLIEMYAVLAQAEMEKKGKRQSEGIETKKLRGEWDDYGRPHALPFEKFAAAYMKVVSGSVSPTECRRQLGLSHTTFYRYRDRYLKELNG
jgi:DNA invertase Pin-like site-specific DNA recombinase